MSLLGKGKNDMDEENLIQSDETVWEYLGKDGLYQMGPRNCRQVILDFIRDSDTRSVLDVGCGSGVLWDLLKQQGIDVIYKGVDYSYTFIDTCKNISLRFCGKLTMAEL